MSRARLILSTLAVAAALVLSACNGDAPTEAATSAPAPPPPPAPGAICEEDVSDGVPVRFGPKDTLGGVTFGTGAKAVVLLHQSNGSLCQWVPYAKELAKAGYLALAFDKPRGYSSQNAASGNHLAVVEAVAYLRGKGATDVTLMGASMGGTGVLAAATQITPPVNGVISLSAPGFYDGVDAVALMPKLAVPVLFVAGESDAQFADNARKLDKATPATVDKTLLVVDSGGHGVDLVDPAGGAAAKRVRAAIDDFLANHMPR